MRRVTPQRAHAAQRWQKKRKKKLSLPWHLPVKPQRKRKKKPSLHLHLPTKLPSKRWMLRSLLLLLLALAAYEMLFSDYFRVKDISVSGNTSLAQDKIEGCLRAALAERQGGWLSPGNLFLLSSGALEKKLSATFNEIDSVSVSKNFPHGISVRIKEKNPALIWCRSNCFFVNEQGIAFLAANDADLDAQNKHFIKITEQSAIPEESEVQRQAIAASVQAAGGGTKPMASFTSDAADLAPLVLNQRVADESFISFALDINNRLMSNPRFKIMYYKTRGYQTRELIAFTDKNTRLYFDTTVSAQQQADNLASTLDKSVKPEQINSLQYVYLKDDDRVFYK